MRCLRAVAGGLRDDSSCRKKIILFSDRKVDRLHYPGPSFQESLPILSALFVARVITNEVLCPLEEPAEQAL